MSDKKVIPITQSSLFEDTRPDALELARSLNTGIERPYGEKDFLLGTSGFTANGWGGSFYPARTKVRDYLSPYATHFHAVGGDSTFYAAPSVSTVNNWYRRTPSDFIFAAKVPQIVAHEK